MDDPKDWNPLLLLVAATAGLFVIHKVNNRYFGWLHRRFPWLFRPKILLLIFAMCFAYVLVVLLLSLPELLKLTEKAR